MVLAVGYLAHGLRDIVHDSRRIPWWYAPVCIGFGFIVGAYLLIRY